MSQDSCVNAPDFATELATIRKRRRRFVIGSGVLLLIFVSLSLLLSLFDNVSTASENIFRVAFGVSAIVWLGLGAVSAASKCPRCGMPFRIWRGIVVPLVSRCIHCKLPLT